MQEYMSECQTSRTPSDDDHHKTHVNENLNENTACLSTGDKSDFGNNRCDMQHEINDFITEITQSMDDILMENEVNLQHRRENRESMLSNNLQHGKENDKAFESHRFTHGKKTDQSILFSGHIPSGIENKDSLESNNMCNIPMKNNDALQQCWEKEQSVETSKLSSQVHLKMENDDILEPKNLSFNTRFEIGDQRMVSNSVSKSDGNESMEHPYLCMSVPESLSGNLMCKSGERYENPLNSHELFNSANLEIQPSVSNTQSCHGYNVQHNSFQNDENLDLSKLRNVVDDNLNVDENRKCGKIVIENIEGKEENADSQHFLLFPQGFQDKNIGILRQNEKSESVLERDESVGYVNGGILDTIISNDYRIASMGQKSENAAIKIGLDLVDSDDVNLGQIVQTNVSRDGLLETKIDGELFDRKLDGKEISEFDINLGEKGVFDTKLGGKRILEKNLCSDWLSDTKIDEVLEKNFDGKEVYGTKLGGKGTCGENGAVEGVLGTNHCGERTLETNIDSEGVLETNLDGGVVETDLGYYWLTSTIDETLVDCAPDRAVCPNIGDSGSICGSNMEEINCGKSVAEDLDHGKSFEKSVESVDQHESDGYKTQAEQISWSKSMSNSNKIVDSINGNNFEDKTLCEKSMDQIDSAGCLNEGERMSRSCSISNENKESLFSSMPKISDLISSLDTKYMSLDRAGVSKKGIRGVNDDFQLKSISNENLTVQPLRRKYSAPASFCKVYKVISIDIPKMEDYTRMDKSAINAQKRHSSGSLSKGGNLTRSGNHSKGGSFKNYRDKFGFKRDVEFSQSADNVINGNQKSNKSGEKELKDLQENSKINVGDDSGIASNRKFSKMDLPVKTDVSTKEKLQPPTMFSDVKDISTKPEYGPAAQPSKDIHMEADGNTRDLNMQPTMVWDPGVPQVPPRTYKLVKLDKHLTLPHTPPPPSPHTSEQLITTKLNGHVTDHVTDEDQSKAPPLPERRRIVNVANVRKVDKRSDRNSLVKFDSDSSRKAEVKGVVRTNHKDKHVHHKRTGHRAGGNQSSISALKEKRNTKDMIEVLESYKFVENFGHAQDTSAIEPNNNNEPLFKSIATNTTDSLDRRKTKSKFSGIKKVKDKKHGNSIYATVLKNNIVKNQKATERRPEELIDPWVKREDAIKTRQNEEIVPNHTIDKATMKRELKAAFDNNIANHLQRKLNDKPFSYSEGMRHNFEHSPDFQVMVNSLSPVLLRRNNSNRSGRRNVGSVETSPETTPEHSPRIPDNKNNVETLHVPNGQQESLFIDPEMARTWHGATSLNWSKHYGPQMKAMMQELDNMSDLEIQAVEHSINQDDLNFEMGSKTLPCKSLLDEMHKKFCSDQYNGSQDSNLARQMVLLRLKSTPIVKPKRSQSFHIRMGTGKSTTSLNSEASPMLHRMHKRIGIKTRPDFQYSPKLTRAREATHATKKSIPKIQGPETKREGAEIEAIEACRWLRETGFPQYAQLYEDGQFPVDIDSVEKDHDFLDKEDIQSLFRRLNTLNKCAIMKIGTPAKKETEDSDDEDQCALSDKWKYQRSSRRWSRKDLDVPFIDTKTGQPVLRSASSHDSLLADQNSSSETGDSPVLDSKMHHHDDMALLKTSSPVDANGNTTIHGGKVIQRAASERIKGAKGLLKRMESLKVKRGRKPKTITEISEPVPTNRADMQAKIKHLNCKEIHVNSSGDKSSHSALSHNSTTVSHSSTNSTSHNTHSDSLLARLDSSVNSSNSNSVVNGNESVRVTFPDTVDEDSSSTSTSATPSLSENVMDLSMSSNGALGLDLSPVSRRSNSSETTNSSEETLFLSGDYKPGKFPTSLDDSLFQGDRSVRARSLSYADENSLSPDFRHSRRGSHDPRNRVHRVSIYDNVPIEEDLQTAQKELDFILSELFQNINGLNKAIYGENAELLEPPTFSSFDDSSLSLDSQTPENEPAVDPSSDFTQEPDENEVISGTLSSPDISDHEHTEDMSHDDSTEQIECRERRDSGVGSSLTRTNSDRRKYRIRWHSFQKSHRPTTENRNLQIGCVSAGQIMVLRKLSLLKLTALIEKYSPNRSGWSLSVPRFMKRHKVPDYKDKNVFGIPFTVMIQRTGQALPQCILHAMRFLRRTSGDAIGIFRKSGVRSRIQKLRNDIEANPELIEYEEQQAYDLADLVKQFFRELPECLLTNKLSDIFISIFVYVPTELRLEALQAAIILMADENRDVLLCLLLFLSDIAKHHNKHQMTASNLAVCFAPSLFNMGGARHPSQTPSPRRTRKNAGIPDARELMEQKAAHECLTVMIQEVKKIFTIPAATLAKCRFRHGDPVTLDQLNGGGANDNNQGYTSYIDSCIQGLLKESREKFRGWVSVSVHNDVDVSYKKVGDGHPLRLWKCTVDIEAPPTEVLNRVIHNRQMWDEDLLQWNSVQKLDEETEVFQYVRNSMAPHPIRDFCVLRSWRSNLPKGACVLISTSIEHPDCELQGGIRAVELASRYLIEPCGTGKSRLTHISRVDMRGHSPEWYKKVYGHICANFMEKICASFKCNTEGPETKV